MPDRARVGQQNEPVSKGAVDAGIPPSGVERRTAPRFSLEETATIHPLAGAAKLEGKITDLSVGGCRFEVDTRYLTGAMLRVELQFQVRGVVFRLLGVTAGRRTANSIGICFVDIPERRKADLVEIIGEIAAAEARNTKAKDDVEQPTVSAEPALPAGKSPAANSMEQSKAISQKTRLAKPETKAHTPQPSADWNVRASLGVLVPVPKHETKKSETARTQATGISEADKGSAPVKTDRRAHRRHPVDTRAKLHLVKTGICMAGCIQDLSLAGCRLRTEELFNVGIYVRVEAEFYLHGLPFRLGGVSQAIINKNTIGVRFLDMSERKRNQLAELIAEIGAQLADSSESRSLISVNAI